MTSLEQRLDLLPIWTETVWKDKNWMFGSYSLENMSINRCKYSTTWIMTALFMEQSVFFHHWSDFYHKETNTMRLSFQTKRKKKYASRLSLVVLYLHLLIKQWLCTACVHPFPHSLSKQLTWLTCRLAFQLLFSLPPPVWIIFRHHLTQFIVLQGTTVLR